jgi:hypothetical protein
MMTKSLYYNLTVVNVCVSFAPGLNDFKLHTPYSIPSSLFPCLCLLDGVCIPSWAVFSRIESNT